MAKRIILCFDGTWNRPGDENLAESEQVETNVRRFYEALAEHSPDGRQQVKWYDQGVGTHWYDQVLGGVTGFGLEFNIMEGYKTLAKNYEDGDEVFVLGFSRGAYTARSLVGFIRNCGLVEKGLVDFKVGIAYGIYRTREDGPDSGIAKAFRRMFSREIKMKFVGVWDTVGALGVPLKLFKDANVKFHEFHDTRLSGVVENAFHAVAVDEHRGPYDVCLWDPDNSAPQRLEQRWFVGAHSDVGGGYKERELSDIPLRWMMDRAQEFGLRFDPARIPAISDHNAHGLLHDSYGDFLKGVYAKEFPPHYRAVRKTAFGNEAVDESVRKRIAAHVGGYQPKNPGLA
jgi:uncharacterized protein (DUF2235 family)